MNSTKVKIVIGANYGDEGKGLATHYFASQAHMKNEKCLNVLYNGGCQRGHTVELKDGTRHVFHHFGSGAFDGADTYFDEEFMVNPIIFLNEYANIGSNIHCFISNKCRVVTPFDMMLNQFREHLRGADKHGSCGMGIFETRKRYEDSRFNLTYGDLIYKTYSEIHDYFKDMWSNYFKPYYDIDHQKQLEYNKTCDAVIDNFIILLREMSHFVKIIEFDRLVKQYDTIIFEGGQGLALDEDLINETPHLTPSHTTSKLPMKRAAEINCKDIEVCYVTRSYFTRHGAGDLPTECLKSDINDLIVDETNVTNEFQDSIRYGKFNKHEFMCRVLKDVVDSSMYWNDKSIDFKVSCIITHLNYLDTDSSIEDYFDYIYKSQSKYAEDVIMKEIK